MKGLGDKYTKTGLWYGHDTSMFIFNPKRAERRRQRQLGRKTAREALKNGGV